MNIFVIGDFMLDYYIEGTVERISPEAPVQVLDVKNNYYKLGGAGNVVLNLAALDVNVYCFGITGTGTYSDILENNLSKYTSKYYLKRITNKTIVKTRVIADQGTQLLRIDKEDKSYFNYDICTVIDLTNINIKESDLIIVSDYAKGTINQSVMNYLKSFDIPIIVDPKPKNINLYENVYAITPNKFELEKINKNINVLNSIKYIVETRGDEGIIVHNDYNTEIIPGKKRQVYNVTGAGDTVVSILAICIVLGYDIITSAKIANEAGGLVVEKPGTSNITLDEFDEIKAKMLP